GGCAVPKLFGNLITINVANPAPGANFTINTPNINQSLTLICWSAVFTTDANVANRVVRFTLNSAFARWGANFLQAASQVNTYTGPASVNGQSDPIGAPGVVLVAHPPLLMGPTGQAAIFSAANHNNQAADQWSNIWALFEVNGK